MANKIVDINTQIKTKLEAMQHLHAVTDYEANELSAYPAATLTFAGSPEAEFGSTAHNQRTIRFNVRLYQERKNFDAEKAERVSRETMDELLTAFDMDTTLSGTVKRCNVAVFDTDYVEREVDTRFCNLTLDCVTLVDSA